MDLNKTERREKNLHGSPKLYFFIAENKKMSLAQKCQT